VQCFCQAATNSRGAAGDEYGIPGGTRNSSLAAKLSKGQQEVTEPAWLQQWLGHLVEPGMRIELHF
jgi:hypothetical protein